MPKSIRIAAALAAAALFFACKKAPSYALDVAYGERGYLVLHVPPSQDEPRGAAYGLRRNDLYVSTGTAAGWMAFWADDPPAFTRSSTTRVLKDPFVLRTRSGRWQVARVPHMLDDGAALLAIVPAADGEPELLYGSRESPRKLRPSGWSAVERVSFLPSPDEQPR